jgi:hypothetical protein
MTEFELVVRHSLERQVPLRSERRPDWTDVLNRAGVTEAPTETANGAFPPRRRRAAFALAAAAVAVIALGASPIGSTAADLGRDAFDGLSSWLQGEPGEPAPASEQAGFEARNSSSYVSFPRDTKLRLLRRARAGGETFSLLGFRSGSSLCLRLVRTNRPEARGTNECVTLRELRSSSAPALVASEAHVQFGNPATSVDGVFGFADDTVQSVVLRRLRGGRRVVGVSSNVFLALRAQPSGTVARHPPFDPIMRVQAVTKAGIHVKVPFIASDLGDYSRGLPTRPSYLSTESPRPGDLPGPKRVQARFTGGTIGWVERREQRGEAWSPGRSGFGRLGTVLFSRAIQPDPDSPLRIGVSLFRPDRHAARGPQIDGLLLCSSELRPLAPNASGAGCVRREGSHFFHAAPLTLSLMGPAQLSLVTGLAADDVARIEVHLASGRVIPAALRDNAYAVSLPSSQRAKLVSYDERGRVIGLTVLPGSATPKPCPRAIFAKPASALGPPAPYERLDLGKRTVNGAPIFGRSPAEIEAALGRPDLVRPGESSNGRRQPAFYYGRRGRISADLIVQFGWRQGRPRALSLSYSSQRVTDSKVGRILRLQPQELQRRIQAAYGSGYELEFAYGSVAGRGCNAEFASRNRRVKIAFGLIPQRPSRPYFVFRHGY